MVTRNALPRSAWTSTAAPGGAQLSPAQVKGLAVHWVGPAVPAAVARGDRDAVASFLEGIRRFHVTGRGWSDIAYQQAVDVTGRRWVLRGWRRCSAANGDAAVNRTHGAVLALIGQGQATTPELQAGLRDAIAEFRTVYPRGTAVVGHGDIRPDPTACPGPELLALVHNGWLNPTRTTATATLEDDMQLTDYIGHPSDRLTVGVALDRAAAAGEAIPSINAKLDALTELVRQLAAKA